VQIRSVVYRIQRLEVENGELRENTGDLQTMLDGAVNERVVAEEQLAEMQLVVLREEEQQKILMEELENRVKGWEEEREASSNIIHELSLEVETEKGSDSLAHESDC
jgi:hypothetical protein